MTPSEKIKKAKSLILEAREDVLGHLKDDTGRTRGAKMLELHNIANLMEGPIGYFSQAGQDRIVDSLLKRKEGGVFADIGGYDGITGSNTLFFELFRNWSGIVVEPTPTQLSKAKVVRNCPCLGYAVSGETGKEEFLEITAGYTQMSGFLGSYKADLLEQVRRNPAHKEVIHTLEKKTLNSIFKEQNFKQIDFVSLDVEGGEMGILENFDFDGFDVDVWSIENNAQSSDLPELMRSKGYELVEFAGVDDIFRKRR